MADKVFLPIILKSENISSHNTIVSGLTHPVHISSSPWCPVSLFLGWGLLAWPWAVGGPSLHSPLGSAHMSWPCHFLLVTATLQGSEQTGRNGPPTSLGFPGGSAGKESTCNLGDLGSIPGSGRSPEGGQGNPLQYSCLEDLHGQRSLAGYGPRSRKES